MGSATPDAVALEQVGGERVTYRQLLDDTLRWAAAYRRLGVGAGDHVATMIPHGMAVPKAWIGLGWLRAVEVPLNTAYIGSLLRYALDLADVTTMVIGVGVLRPAHGRGRFVAPPGHRHRRRRSRP